MRVDEIGPGVIAFGSFDGDLVLGSLVGDEIGPSVNAVGSFDGDRVLGSLVGDTVGVVVVLSIGTGVAVGRGDTLGAKDGLGEMDGNPNGDIEGAEALLLDVCLIPIDTMSVTTSATATIQPPMYNILRYLSYLVSLPVSVGGT